MKTKNCPFCSKEISDEAIICKFCHRLLIDENGNDIMPEAEKDEEPVADNSAEAEPKKTATANDEDKTIVYSKEELQKALEKAAAESVTSEEVVETAEEFLEENKAEKEAEAEQIEQTAEEAVAIEDTDDEQKAYTYEDGEEYYEDGEYPEEYYDDSMQDMTVSDYDPKRTFTITAIITLGILIIIIAAVCVGYKLFGYGGEDTSSTAPISTTAQTTTPTETELTDEYVPQVTDDTTSEAPEETYDSELTDPVTETVSALDSAADSSDDSLSDSTLDSSADSTADSAASTDGAPGFEPEGSYYSWGEAFSLMQNYLDANSLTGSYSYYDGTDGVEMFFSYSDDAGNSTIYRVDLNTGYVTAQ